MITGGSSGIGFAIAQRLAGFGAKVVLIADGQDRLDVAVRALGGAGAQVSSIVCDVGDPVAVRDAIVSLRREHGVPDVLINNAGFAVYRTFEESDPAEIEKLFNVNFAGHLLCTKAVLDGMIARGSGHIVNIASVAGLFTLTPNAVYGAAKSGIVAWSRALRVELDRFGIGVSVVCPGRVETPFFDHETFQRRRARRETRLNRAIADGRGSCARRDPTEPRDGCRPALLGLVRPRAPRLAVRASHAPCVAATTSRRPVPGMSPSARATSAICPITGNASREYARKGSAVYLRDPAVVDHLPGRAAATGGHGRVR